MHRLLAAPTTIRAPTPRATSRLPATSASALSPRTAPRFASCRFACLCSDAWPLLLTCPSSPKKHAGEGGQHHKLPVCDDSAAQLHSGRPGGPQDGRAADRGHAVGLAPLRAGAAPAAYSRAQPATVPHLTLHSWPTATSRRLTSRPRRPARRSISRPVRTEGQWEGFLPVVAAFAFSAPLSPLGTRKGTGAGTKPTPAAKPAPAEKPASPTKPKPAAAKPKPAAAKPKPAAVKPKPAPKKVWRDLAVLKHAPVRTCSAPHTHLRPAHVN